MLSTILFILNILPLTVVFSVLVYIAVRNLHDRCSRYQAWLFKPGKRTMLFVNGRFFAEYPNLVILTKRFWFCYRVYLHQIKEEVLTKDTEIYMAELPNMMIGVPFDQVCLGHHLPFLAFSHKRLKKKIIHKLLNTRWGHIGNLEWHYFQSGFTLGELEESRKIKILIRNES